MDYQDLLTANVLHWNYRGFTEFPINKIDGEESEVTDIYLKDNLITRVPKEIYKLKHLESLYLSGNDIVELPREISMLKCLKCLDLSGNRLRRLPDEIGEVRSLRFLILDENELVELPLRLAELRGLRYLSVCDNKLHWLPQRPVYNYHYCEFRFWRNINLKVIPYALWYHMFRDQMTRSLNIGCLKIPTYQCVAQNYRCRLKLSQDSRQWELDIDVPHELNNIQRNNSHLIPSLFELSKRQLYKTISDTADKFTKIHQDNLDTNLTYRINYYNDNYVDDLEINLEGFSLINEDPAKCDENGNNCKINQPLKYRNDDGERMKRNKNDYYVPTDVVEKYYNFLPAFIKSDLCNGPISRCENVACKRPIFDYVYYEFCIGKIILIDNTEEILLSAAFCSKQCAIRWKTGKLVIPWTFIEN
ncbi:leucine-rich repeat-containing protein 28-like [Plodia interpunctella]|uniref:leucine-rich repeat-containing protein 28-like n=1 Tax=Plodia interpunctella TaxID=58824 RepID=UPI00310115A7